MKAKYFIYLILSLFLFFVFIMPEINARKNRTNASKIKIGMTADEVIKILGEPKFKGIPFASIEQADSTYRYQTPFGSSDGIYISFDTTGKVIHIANE